jgi:hypothetical protein
MAEQFDQDPDLPVERARTEDVVAEALARQAAMRKPLGPAKRLETTPPTPKVRKQRRTMRRRIPKDPPG